MDADPDVNAKTSYQPPDNKRYQSTCFSVLTIRVNVFIQVCQHEQTVKETYAISSVLIPDVGVAANIRKLAFQ